MGKKCIFILVITFFMPFLFIHALADTEKSVYIGSEEAERIAEIASTQSDFMDFLSNDKLEICKDRIMQLYEFDPLDYAREGVLKIEPVSCSTHSENTQNVGNVYVARLVYIEGGEYAGYIQFCIEDNRAYMDFFAPSRLYEDIRFDGYAFEVILPDYLENQERMRSVLEEDITEEDVILVKEPIFKKTMTTERGYVFYVSLKGKEDVLFYPESIEGDRPVPVKYIPVESELKEKSDAALEEFLWLEEIVRMMREKHEKERPGEPFVVVGAPGDLLNDSADTQLSLETSDETKGGNGIDTSEVIMEKDIQPENDEDKTISNDNQKKYVILYWFVPIVSVGAIGAIIGIRFLRKKSIIA